MPVPTGDGGWIVINNPLNFALNSSPLIKLMAAGWICVGELQQDVEPLNRRGLVMAPSTQVFGVGPERFELREFEFDHLRWFSGTEVLNRSPVQPAQPADEFPTVVTLHCAPTVLRWQGCQAANTSFDNEPDVLRGDAWGEKGFTGLKMATLRV